MHRRIVSGSIIATGVVGAVCLAHGTYVLATGPLDWTLAVAALNVTLGIYLVARALENWTAR